MCRFTRIFQRNVGFRQCFSILLWMDLQSAIRFSGSFSDAIHVFCVYHYPMAWHGTALDRFLSTIHHMKYSISDYGMLKTFHIRVSMKADCSDHCLVIVKAYDDDTITITHSETLLSKAVPGHGITELRHCLRM